MTLSVLRLLKRALVLAGLALVGCASSAKAPADFLRGYLQQVDESGVKPSPTREIRVMESIVWLNTSRENSVTVVLRKSCKSEMSCLTASGFRPGAGELTLTGLLPPGGAASLCFHEAGSFEYEVQGLGRAVNGRIVVKAAGPGMSGVRSGDAKADG